MTHLNSSQRNILSSTSHGFTLIELIVVITIAGILATLAMPSFTQMMERNRVSSIAGQFMRSMNYARSEAVSTGRTVVVCAVSDVTANPPVCKDANGEWTQGWIVFVDNNSDGKYELSVDGAVLSIFDSVMQGYALTNATNISWLAFNSQGLVRFDGNLFGSTFTVLPPSGNASANTRQIVFARTGRMRLQNVQTGVENAD